MLLVGAGMTIWDVGESFNRVDTNVFDLLGSILLRLVAARGCPGGAEEPIQCASWAIEKVGSGKYAAPA
jgi:hypothetical protein